MGGIYLPLNCKNNIMTEPIIVAQKKYSKQFPSIRYLLVCYFHEDMFDVFDWNEESPNYKGIIRYFKIEDSSIKQEELFTELSAFIKTSQNWDEDKLREILKDDLGNCFRAPFFKITYREFLEGILEILEEPMEKTKSEFIPKFIG